MVPQAKSVSQLSRPKCHRLEEMPMGTHGLRYGAGTEVQQRYAVSSGASIPQGSLVQSGPFGEGHLFCVGCSESGSLDMAQCKALLGAQFLKLRLVEIGCELLEHWPHWPFPFLHYLDIGQMLFFTSVPTHERQAS